MEASLSDRFWLGKAISTLALPGFNLPAASAALFMAGGVAGRPSIPSRLNDKELDGRANFSH